MIIRPAAIPDLPAIVGLERASFGADAYPAVFLRQTLDLWPQLIRVADDEPGVLGYALAAPSSAELEGWILAVTVRPDVRGRGIGRALTHGVIERLREDGFRKALLTVHPENTIARELYQDLGFVVVAEDPEYFGPGEPRLRLELFL